MTVTVNDEATFCWSHYNSQCVIVYEPSQTLAICSNPGECSGAQDVEWCLLGPATHPDIIWANWAKRSPGCLSDNGARFVCLFICNKLTEMFTLCISACVCI